MFLIHRKKTIGFAIVVISASNFCQAQPGDMPADSVMIKVKQLIGTGINYLFHSDSILSDSVMYHGYQTISETDILTQPVESITELVSIQAGAVGAHFRGGRASGTVFYLDGFSLRRPCYLWING